MRKGSGWANPDIFAVAFRQVMDTFIEEHQRRPSRREFSRIAGRLLSAAHHHHGGFTACVHRYGYGHWPTKPWRRPAPKVKPPRRLKDWSDPLVQNVALSSIPGDWSEWGIFPSSTAVRKKYVGLYAYFQRKGNWAAEATRRGLLPPVKGRVQQRLALLMIKVLDWYELHGRWPTQLDVGVLSRRYNYSANGWGMLFSRTDFHPVILRRLLDRLILHLQWVRRHQPNAFSERLEIANRFLGALNTQLSLHRLARS